MRDAELHEIIFNVLISRNQKESHTGLSLNLKTIKALIKEGTAIFEQEKSMLRLHGNFIVVGDIHGNIKALIQIFERFQFPPLQKYLFLGDYVDRGENSIEVLLLLYSLKLLFPNHIYLLRGNHETKNISSSYGFKDECLSYLNKRCYALFCKSFNCLSLAAILNDSIFCVHGGLSPSINNPSDIEKIQKPVKDVYKSDVIDLLWSDPSPDVGAFEDSPRKAGYLFGSDVIDQFLIDNNLKMIIRAHEFCDNGFQYTFDNCLTVFSAFDYQGRMNESAVAQVDKDHVQVINLAQKTPDDVESYMLDLPVWLFDDSNAMKNFSPEFDLPYSHLNSDLIPILV